MQGGSGGSGGGVASGGVDMMQAKTKASHAMSLGRTTGVGGAGGEDDSSSTQPQWDEEVMHLQAMGYSNEAARRALAESKGSVQGAIEVLTM
jgi:hypothetical protein